MDCKLLGGIFLEGVLSFLSPCVLPLIPLYISYLAGDNKTVDEQGNVTYKTSKVFLTTLFFVAGISLTFVLLALSASALKTFLDQYNEVISIIGGTLLIIFGLHELGLFSIDILNKEFKPKFEMHLKQMNCLKAFLLGFVFSLGWSPCIGPLLSNALLMALTDPQGYLYIAAYASGLIIPFLICGLFTSKVLDFINKKQNIYKYVLKISGIILIVFGCYMIYNASRSIKEIKSMTAVSEKAPGEEESVESYLYGLKLKDTEDKEVSLSDFKGKYILLNFTATWCAYCDMEMPELVEFAKEKEDTVCLCIFSPQREKGGEEMIKTFVTDKNYGIRTLLDVEDILFYYCGINSYPTTFIISPEGRFLTYVNGAMNKDNFNQMLEYAKNVDVSGN